MHTDLYADAATTRRDDALVTSVSALAAARPMLVDVVPAREVVPHLADGGACHAGPPIDSADMCAPMRAALGVALALEGMADTPAAALALADAGAVPLLPNHDCGGVAPMSGVVTGSMPVLVAIDRASATMAWCPLNEGSGRVLRYGADGPDVVERLRWMHRVLGRSLARALARTGPLDLIALQRRALVAGDELHHHTHHATLLLQDALGYHLPPRVSAFIVDNHQFALNVAMVSAKVALQAASGVPGSALVTVIARNGVEVGVKLSGTGDRWFTGPAAMPEPARLEPGYGPADMQRDLGDSAIVEVYGLGALAVEASPESAPSVGLDPAEAPAIQDRLRRIAAAAHPAMGWLTAGGPAVPAILGVDAAAVVRERIVPPIHTGIAHREPGVGQIGGGVTLPPIEAFDAAVAELEEAPLAALA
jgi:Protein of unknown function (DUF1116)